MPLADLKKAAATGEPPDTALSSGSVQESFTELAVALCLLGLASSVRRTVQAWCEGQKQPSALCGTRREGGRNYCA